MPPPVHDAHDTKATKRQDNSCLSGRNILCALVKTKSPESIRARYKAHAAKIEAEVITRAESTAYEEEHNDAVTTVEFRIQKHVEFGEELRIVGSVRELGEWDARSSSIAMEWGSGDMWSCVVTVKRADVARLEYKYFVRSDEGSLRWEVGGNHNVLKTPERHMVQEDFWEFPGYNCRV